MTFTSVDIFLLSALWAFCCGCIAFVAWLNKRAYREAVKYIERGNAYMQDTRLAGLYIILNTMTGAQYFGSTKKNLMARWGQHIGQLNLGKHENARLQEDWLIYGMSAFAFLIVETADSFDAINALPDRERRALEDRAQRIPPMLNYNVAHSRAQSRIWRACRA